MNSRQTVLVIEDDAHIRQWLETSLGADGYEVQACSLLQDARVAFEQCQPDVVLLDLTLPDGDGLHWINWARSISEVPILVLSARLDESQKVDALNRGADDYVSKPFGIQEILARVRALLRRLPGKAEASTLVRLGRVKIKTDLGTVTRDGQPVKLTAKEYAVLAVLARQPGKLIRHRELLQTVWGPEFVDDTHYLRILMSKLRLKLEENPAAPVYLLTEPGMGYRLNTD